jgi:hypothetical protein
VRALKEANKETVKAIVIDHRKLQAGIRPKRTTGLANCFR